MAKNEAESLFKAIVFTLIRAAFFYFLYGYFHEVFNLPSLTAFESIGIICLVDAVKGV